MSQAYNLNDACSEDADVRKAYGGSTFGGPYVEFEIINLPTGENASSTILAMNMNDGDLSGTSTVNERGCSLIVVIIQFNKYPFSIC